MLLKFVVILNWFIFLNLFNFTMWKIWQYSIQRICSFSRSWYAVRIENPNDEISKLIIEIALILTFVNKQLIESNLFFDFRIKKSNKLGSFIETVSFPNLLSLVTNLDCFRGNNNINLFYNFLQYVIFFRIWCKKNFRRKFCHLSIAPTEFCFNRC